MTRGDIEVQTLTYKEIKTYLMATIFVAGNILLPRLCHLIPNGGLTLLPIYFFSLIAAYRYGWQVGVLTAIISPFANHLLFGMPDVVMLQVIVAKSLILVMIASSVSLRCSFNHITKIALIIIAYQGVGVVVEWAILNDLSTALEHLRIGAIGMIAQLCGGYIFVKNILK